MNEQLTGNQLAGAYPKGGPISVAYSNAQDPFEAFETIADQLAAKDSCFILLFFPDGFCPEQTQAAIRKHFPGNVVFGASTAGQITPEGYDDTAWLAMSFPKVHFHIASCLIKPLVPFSLEVVSHQVQTTARRFARTAEWNRLGILIADGLSKQEDVLISSLAASLPDIPIFGGSAAEHNSSNKTMIYADGLFHNNAAILLLIETNLEFSMINFDHFKPTDKKMVVTKAIPDERIVQEINGVPAAYEYARIIGVAEEDLSPQLFAQYPVLIKSGSRYHVRSIQKIDANGGLSMLCSIDEGLILTLGSGREIVRTLESELKKASHDKRKPAFILAFDCFLRRLEIEYQQRVGRASKVLADFNVVGFNTFGEQHSGMHVNQTFVGIAFYESDRPAWTERPSD